MKSDAAMDHLKDIHKAAAAADSKQTTPKTSAASLVTAALVGLVAGVGLTVFFSDRD